MKVNVLSLAEALEAEHGCSRELIFQCLEEAFCTAVKKLHRTDKEAKVSINRDSGEIKAEIGGELIDHSSLSRLSFYEARNYFLKRLNEFKESNIKGKYQNKVGSLISCKVIKNESEYTLLETADKTTAVLQERDQIPGESSLPNTHVKAILLGFKIVNGTTVLMLSRKKDEFVKALLELEIPELRDGQCKIVRIARDAGYRVKVLVDFQNTSTTNSVGSCLGYMGTRIKNIIEELKGERIDIIQYSEDEKTLIKNSLKPVEVVDVKIERANQYAQVFVEKGNLSQAIGKGGRNVKLASKLCGWELDVFELEGARAPAIEQKTEK